LKKLVVLMNQVPLGAEVVFQGGSGKTSSQAFSFFFSERGERDHIQIPKRGRKVHCVAGGLEPKHPPLKTQ